MKKSLQNKFATLVFIALSHATFAQWTQISNTSVQYVNAFSAKGDTIFAANLLAGAYVSANKGVTWTSSTNGLSVGSNAVLTTNSFVLAGTNGSGVYKSTNNGASWAASNTGIPASSKIKAFFQDGTNIFVGIENKGAYVTSDGGNTWTLVTDIPNTLQVSVFAFDGTNMYAGTTGGVYRSANHGANWTLVNSTTTDIGSIAIIGTNLFAGTGSGVYISSDNGSTWTAVNTGLPSGPIILAMFASGANLFTGVYGAGVYQSTDNGANWTPINSGIPSGATVQAFVIGGTNMYAAIFQGTNGVYSRPLSQLISGINTVSANNKINLSPNPTDGKFRVETNSNEKQNVTVTDMNGRTVLHQAINGNADIDAANLNEGVYNVNVFNDTQKINKRLVIVK